MYDLIEGHELLIEEILSIKKWTKQKILQILEKYKIDYK